VSAARCAADASKARRKNGKKLRAAGVALEKKETRRQDKTMVATTTRSRSRPQVRDRREMRVVALLLLAVAAGPTLAAPDHDEACESIPAEIHLIKGKQKTIINHFSLDEICKIFFCRGI